MQSRRFFNSSVHSSLQSVSVVPRGSWIQKKKDADRKQENQSVSQLLQRCRIDCHLTLAVIEDFKLLLNTKTPHGTVITMAKTAPCNQILASGTPLIRNCSLYRYPRRDKHLDEVMRRIIMTNFPFKSDEMLRLYEIVVNDHEFIKLAAIDIIFSRNYIDENDCKGSTSNNKIFSTLQKPSTSKTV